MSKAIFFLQAFNGVEVGSHIPDSYYGEALYEGIKIYAELGYAARSEHLLKAASVYGHEHFYKAAIFPAPLHDSIKAFYP